MRNACSGRRFTLDSSVESRRIALVGAGNLATSLGVALAAAGAVPVAVWSRTKESGRALGNRLGCPSFTEVCDMPAADVVIISVTDNAIAPVAADVATRYKGALVVHTAGSVSMDVLREAGISKCGVFYPMQTFSKQKIVDFRAVTIFVEGCCDAIVLQLEELASLLTTKIVRATSEQRKSLHIAAVFACNFTNAAYCMAASLLEANGLSFDSMLPLIEETAAKVHAIHPADAQTGPACRGDVKVIDSHLAMLHGNLKEVYSLMSEYIKNEISVNKQ